MTLIEPLIKLRRRVCATLVQRAAIPIMVTSDPALIVAPHPDDETFACGGLIMQKKSTNTQVSIVFLTSGETSHRECCNTTPDKIASARRRLAVEAGRLLGLKEEDMFWLGLSDGNIPEGNEPDFNKSVKSLVRLIDEIKPYEIYVPHYSDCWPDHEAASAIVCDAMKAVNYHCELYYYPVWMWHNLRFRSLSSILNSKVMRVDISTVRERKKIAINHYLSGLNPDCGKPFCGNLPDGFTDHFQYDYEIFFGS
jgi:LmbE family N-acetylglucosaminyl deacetylase